MRGRVNNRSCRLFIVFFVLTLTFSLISAGSFKGYTSISMVAYAKKSKKPSDTTSNDESGRSDKDKGGSDATTSGSHAKGPPDKKGSNNKNIDQLTNDNQKKGREGQQGTEPTIPPPPDETTLTPTTPPAPPTCEKWKSMTSQMYLPDIIFNVRNVKMH